MAVWVPKGTGMLRLTSKVQLLLVLQGSWRPSSSSPPRKEMDAGCVDADAITLALLVDSGLKGQTPAVLLPSSSTARPSEDSSLITPFCYQKILFVRHFSLPSGNRQTTLKLCSSILLQVVQEMSFGCAWPQRLIPVSLVVGCKFHLCINFIYARSLFFFLGSHRVPLKGVTTASSGLGMAGQDPQLLPTPWPVWLPVFWGHHPIHCHDQHCPFGFQESF